MSSVPTGAQDATALVARTEMATGAAASAPLLELLPRDGLAWVRRGEGLVGWGVAAQVRVTGPDRFAAAQAWWDDLVAHSVVRDDVRLPGSGLVAFGSFTFADGPDSSVLVVPSIVVGRRGSTTWVTGIAAQPGLPRSPQLRPATGPAAPAGLAFADGSVAGPEWTETVRQAVDRIVCGELDKVVLARDLLAVADEPIDTRWPLLRLARAYPACWTFQVDGMLGSTPELLVRLERGLVTSRVLAGTIRRTGDDERDLALSASLARSSKDLEEHEYAVRSVADGLAPYCTGMNVPETPFVLHLANVMHLATDVAGVLAGPERSLELAAALHPSAAVCGTPTPVAAQVIRELEPMDRGRYAGPVGWTDAAGDGEWGIALRSASVVPGEPSKLRLYAGCGIVAGSDPDDELAENQAKLLPMRDALGT